MLSAMRYSPRPFNLELLWTGPQVPVAANSQ
jgi:hypothetical protein